jgi:hypothetical protein
MKRAGYFVLLGLLLFQCKPKADNTVTQFAGKPGMPATIKKEHTYLLGEIGKLALLKDSTGRAAVKLNELMQHHFEEEEDYVLPPLGLLPFLAEGGIPPQSKEVIGLTEKLKTQLLHMKAEHQLIKAYMDEVVQAANKDHHPEVVVLEQAIGKHAAMEEEVFFPTAILVGEFLKLKNKEQ